MATKSFSAQIGEITDKIAKNMDLIAKDAIQTTFHAMTEVQPSVEDTGGTFAVGKVPVKTGYLVGTAFCAVNGEQTAAGNVGSKTPPDFSMGVAGMRVGDVVVGAFTAPYARRIEYGFSGTDSLGRTYNQAGRFFVRQAAQGWEANVKAAARKFN
jgi:hypothetical protein